MSLDRGRPVRGPRLTTILSLSPSLSLRLSLSLSVLLGRHGVRLGYPVVEV